MDEQEKFKGYCQLFETFGIIETGNFVVTGVKGLLFATFTYTNLRDMAEQILRVACTISQLPSLDEVMRCEDMRVEVKTVMPITVVEEAVRVNSHRIRLLCEAAVCEIGDRHVPGNDKADNWGGGT